MKLKTWHLFVFVFVLFITSFYVINLKFDRFYRVNGINNDNRVLIEKYLTDKEQEYLIDNQIPIDQFIQYIEYDKFELTNYQYYEILKETNRYSNDEEILEIGNGLATRMNFLFKEQAVDKTKELVDARLENAFLEKEIFDFNHIDFYKDISVLYDSKDYSFVDDTENYLILLDEFDTFSQEEKKKVFSDLCASYNKNSLKTFFNTPLESNVTRVYNPNALTTIVDKTHYIGNYEPKEILLIQDIPRLNYAMYLQSGAYSALKDMYSDLSKEHENFIIYNAYTSPQNLDNDNVGYNEFQLGLSISVSQTETPSASFQYTDLSKWLEDNSYKYGFILRYPKNKASVTNQKYNPHVYRYVGKEAALKIHEDNIALEEYESE